MARSLNEIIAGLPADEQAAIEARYQELRQEVEGLRELRRLAGNAQAQIASSMGIRQPSVSKIEQQADMYLSTLRSYVEAVGGTLDLIVSLPDHAPIHLRSLGEASNGDGGGLSE